MAYVIVSSLCQTEKAARCVEACPVDCIHPDPRSAAEAVEFAKARSLFIDPRECIDCGQCLPECPVGAIFFDEELPEKHTSAVRENREFFERRRRPSSELPKKLRAGRRE
jgi:NAD-dependent dihydropyrimidine dehydrogenase PreA subunit